MNNNKIIFDKLCRYIWQENPEQFIVVRVNSVATDEREQTYRFAAPDDPLLTGTISITEAGMIDLAKRLGYTNIRIIVQRGKQGRFAIPDPEQMEKERLEDY